MLTKEQANSVAESFLAKQRAAKNAAASAIPRRYQCEDLNRLEPWQRSEVLRKAKLHVERSWRINISLVVWAATWLLVWYLIARQTVPIFLAAILSFAPQFTVRDTLIRREVKLLASKLVASGQL
jgi:Flp pilus assembly protein TadB